MQILLSLLACPLEFVSSVLSSVNFYFPGSDGYWPSTFPEILLFKIVREAQHGGRYHFHF